MLERYASHWQWFMRENYPERVEELQNEKTYEEVAHKVGEQAMELHEILSTQYDKANGPIPEDWWQSVKWEETKRNHIRSQVEREICLQYR